MLYAILKPLAVVVMRVLFRFEVQGTEHIPPGGPVLLVSNHVSLLDPPHLPVELGQVRLGAQRVEMLGTIEPPVEVDRLDHEPLGLVQRMAYLQKLQPAKMNLSFTLENSKIELKIGLKGGRVYSARLKDYRTHDSLPLILFSGDSTVFGFNFFTSDNKAVQTNNLYFKPVSEQRSYDASRTDQSVILRLMAGEDKYIEYKYTLAPEKYMLGFEVTLKSMDGIIASNQNSLTLDWKMYIPQQEKGRQNEENYATIKYKYYQDDVDGLKMRSNKEQDKLDIPTKLSWVAFQDQFFLRWL